MVKVTCPNCKGTGKSVKDGDMGDLVYSCSRCGGTGEVHWLYSSEFSDPKDSDQEDY